MALSSCHTRPDQGLVDVLMHEYLLMLLLRVDIIVGEDQVADGEGEDGNWYGDTVEEGAGNLPVVQLGDHSPRLQTGVETREVQPFLAEGFWELWTNFYQTF